MNSTDPPQNGHQANADSGRIKNHYPSSRPWAGPKPPSPDMVYLSSINTWITRAQLAQIQSEAGELVGKTFDGELVFVSKTKRINKTQIPNAAGQDSIDCNLAMMGDTPNRPHPTTARKGPALTSTTAFMHGLATPITPTPDQLSRKSPAVMERLAWSPSPECSPTFVHSTTAGKHPASFCEPGTPTSMGESFSTAHQGPPAEVQYSDSESGSEFEDDVNDGNYSDSTSQDGSAARRIPLAASSGNVPASQRRHKRLQNSVDSQNRLRPFLTLLALYLNDILPCSVPADSAHINLRCCRTLLDDEFYLSSNNGGNSERANKWIGKGSSMSTWRLKDLADFTDMLVCGEVAVGWEGRLWTRVKGVGLRGMDESLVKSMSRSCIPWSRKLWREGLAVDMGPFKHQSLTTLVNQSETQIWDPFMLCTVPAYPATGYESDCDADGEYEIDLYDGSVANSVHPTLDNYTLEVASAEYDALVNSQKVAENHLAERNPTEPNTDATPVDEFIGVSAIEELDLQHDIPTPENIPEEIPDATLPYSREVPVDSYGNVLPHPPIGYPLSEDVRTYPMSDLTLAEAPSFKGDHDVYFPPTQELIRQHQKVTPYDPNDRAPARFAPRIIQVPLYPVVQSQPLVIHPGLEVEEILQQVADGIIQLPQCAVLLPEQIRTPTGCQVPENRIQWYHPGNLEPVYADDPDRTKPRITTAERMMKKQEISQKIRQDRTAEVMVDDDGIDEGRQRICFAPELEKAGGDLEGPQAAHELWVKRQGRGKISQRGRKPRIKTEEEKAAELAAKEVRKKQGAIRRAQSQPQRKTPYTVPKKEDTIPAPLALPISNHITHLGDGIDDLMQYFNYPDTSLFDPTILDSQQPAAQIERYSWIHPNIKNVLDPVALPPLNLQGNDRHVEFLLHLSDLLIVHPMDVLRQDLADRVKAAAHSSEDPQLAASLAIEAIQYLKYHGLGSNIDWSMVFDSVSTELAEPVQVDPLQTQEQAPFDPFQEFIFDQQAELEHFGLGFTMDDLPVYDGWR